VCCPSKVLSRITSRHQKVTFTISAKSPRPKSESPDLKECLCSTSPDTLKKAENDVKNGHGLASTIWKE
jgi:hypothetical protein